MKTIEEVKEYVKKIQASCQWVHDNKTNTYNVQKEGEYAARSIQLILDYIDSEETI